MYKSKLNYFLLIFTLLSELINLFIYLSIIPFFIWKINNSFLMILFLVALAKRNKSKDKNKFLTLIGFIFIFILFFTDILILIKFN